MSSNFLSSLPFKQIFPPKSKAVHAIVTSTSPFSCLTRSHSHHQAPKTIPPAAKQALILTYLRQSRTVHSIKDLERVLPTIASINSMQVKDYLQALTDENQIRVEKIGSGNWYWSFASEERQKREVVLEGLVVERGRLEGLVGELERRVRDVKVEMGGGGGGDGDGDDGRDEVLAEHTRVKVKVEAFRTEIKSFAGCDPVELDRKRVEIGTLKERASRWTDNIYCLEAKLKEAVGGDRETMERLWEMYYGDEYVEGEGLRELIF
ncbi:hypothetical protein MMC25_002517 [Agyrium rufum]|nr:hypothetical protein [Agyrium rufum]